MSSSPAQRRAPASGPGADLGQRRSPDLRGVDVLLLVPVGSTEQHGPHLPLATDAMVATHACRMAATLLATAPSTAPSTGPAAPLHGSRRALVAPALPYGASGEHEGFPGTISIGHAALLSVLVELGRSACGWATGLIFVNGHGGNALTVRDATLQLRREGRPVAWTSCDVGGDAHAGHSETSMLLDLAPAAVRMDLAEAGCTTPVARLMPRLRTEGVRGVSPNGVLGDPTGASRVAGHRLLHQLVGRLVAELTDLDVADDGRLRS